VFASSLIMCLDRKQQSKATWKINLEVICEAQEELFGFERFGEYDGPVLFLAGKDSFQYEIEKDRRFYLTTFPNIREQDIIHVEGAGHWLHYEKQDFTISSVAKFLREIDGS